MLSKERLEEIIGQFEHVIYPAEVGEMARELLRPPPQKHTNNFYGRTWTWFESKLGHSEIPR